MIPALPSRAQIPPVVLGCGNFGGIGSGLASGDDDDFQGHQSYLGGNREQNERARRAMNATSADNVLRNDPFAQKAFRDMD